MQGVVHERERRERSRVGKFLVLFPAVLGVCTFGTGEVRRPAHFLEQIPRPELQASRHPPKEQPCSQPHQSSHLFCMAAQRH